MTEVCFAINFFEFSEECVIAGYGDMVIAAVLQGDEVLGLKGQSCG